MPIVGSVEVHLLLPVNVGHVVRFHVLIKW